MALDETQLERLVISLEANTSKLDDTMRKSSALLDKQLTTMEARTQTWAQRMEKSLGGSATAAGRAFAATMSEGERSLTRFAGQLGPLGGILESVGGGGLVAAGGVGLFAYALEQGTERAAAYERQIATINGVLRATQAASGQTGASIEAMAERISGATLQTREGVLQAATELLSFKSIGPDVFEPTLKLAADMAQVFGTDVADSAKRLGLAMDDPVQGMNLLRRAGVDLSVAQKEVIKNLEETGDKAGAQQVLLKALQDRIGGAGAAAHTGLTGAAHDLSEAWNRLLVDFANTNRAGSAAAGGIDLVTRAINTLDGAIKNSGGGLEFIARLASAGIGNPLPQLRGASSATTGTGSFSDLSKYNAFFGPALAKDQAQDALVAALHDATKAIVAQSDELKKSPLQQAIDKKLDELAQKSGVSKSELLSNPAYAADVAAVREAATAEYNLTEARKDAKKAAEEAKEAEKKRLEALSESAKQSLEGLRLVDEINARLKGNEPGAARTSYVNEQLAKLSPDNLPVYGGQVSQAAGRVFDANTLDEQLQKGRELVRNYQDQTSALQADHAAAEAEKFELDALVEVYQKTGTVSKEAADAIHAQAEAILNAGHAAKQAEDEYQRGVQTLDDIRGALENVAASSIRGFHSMRDAAKEFVQQLAELIIKLYIMKPLLEALLGPQGTAGGGLLGAGAGAGAATASTGGIFSSIGALFGFAEGGRVRGPGGSASDRVLARLSPGEFVVDADAAAKNLPMLYAMNAGALPGYANGGYVSAPRVASPAGGGGFGHTYVTIDARGAQEGVADQIDAKLRAVLPGFGAGIMAQYDRTLPDKISNAFRDRF